MSIRREFNKESSYEISLKLDEKCRGGISYSSQIVFFQSLHYTCFSSAICPLQVPASDTLCIALSEKGRNIRRRKRERHKTGLDYLSGHLIASLKRAYITLTILFLIVVMLKY